MRTIVAICAIFALAGCATPEQKAQARYAKWAEACMAPASSNPFRQALNESQAMACIERLEAAYQADRRRSVASSAALLGYSAALMTPPAGSGGSTNCTSIQSGGMYPAWRTTCY
jgi:hypothetical protein